MTQRRGFHPPTGHPCPPLRPTYGRREATPIVVPRARARRARVLGVLGGWGLALSAGCVSTGDSRVQTSSGDDESSTGGDSSLTVGSLVTGIDDTSNPQTEGPPDDGSGSDSDGGSGSEDTSTGGGVDLPAYCGDEIPAAGDDPLLDDLEPEPGQMLPDDRIPELDGRVGYWFTYNDGSPGGAQTPAPGRFQPAPGGAAGTGYEAATSGDGFTTWGAGMGVKLNNDFSGDCPYDVTSYDGITFQARGDVTVRFSITTRATHPITDGGTCDPNAGQCSDHFGLAIPLDVDWQVYTVTWAELTQQGWGIDAEFDPGQIIEIQWQAPALAPFDVHVDELSLWRK